MSRVISIIVGLGVTVWSLISLGTYLVVNVIGGSLSRNADAFFGSPEMVVFMSDAFRFFTTLGLGAVVVIWLLGVAAIAAAGWMVRRIAS